MKLTARVVDAATGQPVEARVQVLAAGGYPVAPAEAIHKVGTGLPFFYCDGELTVDVPRGKTRLLAERGTEYRPCALTLDATTAGAMAVDLPLERWTALGERGWHPGNTHIHYDQNEQRPDDRLRLDPRVEDLRVTAISILRRQELPYASNRYAPGVLTDFSTEHHYVECGEECRHNDRHDSMDQGYGHVMFLRIRERVDPVSRGFLVDDTDPDYPPLCFACDEARRQEGLVIWCHNGRGMEAPVAAALGKLDAVNLFDAYWMDPEYDLWYALLNCGIRLPASTGSDWFLSSANRVYVDTGGSFGPDAWFAGLRAGRTFVTNGPAVFLRVGPAGPGATLALEPGAPMPVTVSWESFHAVEQVEIVRNGKVVAGRTLTGDACRQGEWTLELAAPEDGWVAARLGGSARDSFFHPVFAHTSPVYVRTGVPSVSAGESAALLVRRLASALEWIAGQGRYPGESQRREVADLFRQGQAFYRKMAGG